MWFLALQSGLVASICSVVLCRKPVTLFLFNNVKKTGKGNEAKKKESLNVL